MLAVTYPKPHNITMGLDGSFFISSERNSSSGTQECVGSSSTTTWKQNNWLQKHSDGWTLKPSANSFGHQSISGWDPNCPYNFQWVYTMAMDGSGYFFFITKKQQWHTAVLKTLDQTSFSLSQPFSKPFRGSWSGNGWRRLFFISSPRNSSGGAAVFTSAARRHSRVRRRQIECHGEIAISTLNRKFALTSDVEPCLITRFKLRGRRKARLSKLTFKKNIAIFVQCNLRVLTKTCPNLSKLVQNRCKICINIWCRTMHNWLHASKFEKEEK